MQKLPFNVKIFLTATGVFALIIIGVGVAVLGAYLENDEITEIGKISIGIGILVIIGFFILSWKQKKNYFKS